MPKISIGYLAAFIDGEGCIYVHKNNNRHYSLVLRIANKCLHALEMVQNDFGGNVNKKDKMGNYSITWSGEKAKLILRLVFDELIIKRQQAEVALEFPIFERGVKKAGGWNIRYSESEKEMRELIYQLLKKLKKEW